MEGIISCRQERRIMKQTLLMLTVIMLAGCSAPAPRADSRGPEPPVLSSTTHPAGEWSKNPVAIMTWKAPAAEIRGYAITMNKSPQFEVQPLVNLDPDAVKFTAPDLPDGTHYFHLRVIDAAGVPGATGHYKLQICADTPSAPEVKSPTHPEGRPVANPSPKFIWNETGQCVRGYYYSLSEKGSAEPDRYLDRNGIEFKNLKSGKYTFSLRAESRTGIRGGTARYVIIID
jgi:hypothetical protein